MVNRTPAYNLMVVLKETGLKADVLRAWERRYNLPHPQRTEGGHHLYSEYDIAVVKWLNGRRAEGFSISRAVQLWKDLLASGQDPLEAAMPAKISPSVARAVGTNIESLRQQWLKGCLTFDAVKAEEALNQAFSLYQVEKTCSAILQQGLQIIGEEWYLGKVSVQQEHFASALAIRRLETVINASPQPTRSQTVLVGCPSGEAHTFPALLLSLFLQRLGLKVVYLGADIPVEQMDAAVAVIHPDLVVLAAQQLVTADSLASMALTLRERDIPLAYGGLIFNRLPEVRKRIAATFLGESLEEGVNKIEQLLLAPVSSPTAVGVDESYLALARLFRQARPLIEHAFFEKLHKDSLRVEKIEDINSFFGNRLAASLDLGDLAFMESELDWVNGFLVSHPIMADELLNYLTEYSQCIHAELGQEGALITDWLDQYVSRKKMSQK